MRAIGSQNMPIYEISKLKEAGESLCLQTFFLHQQIHGCGSTEMDSLSFMMFMTSPVGVLG